MADDNGNPGNTTDPRYQPLPEVKPVAPAPRVNPPNINSAKENAPAGGPPAFGDFLEWMRVQMGGAAAPAETTQRTLIPKEKKKFQRRDADARTENPAASPGEAEGPAKSSSPTTEKPPAPVRELPVFDPEAARASRTTPGDAADLVTTRVRRGQQTAVKRNAWVGLAIQIGVLALLAGSFLLGRASVTRTAPAPVAAPAAPQTVNQEGKVTTKLLSDSNAALIDQAMAAEQASDFKKARELLEKVKASGERVHGLAFQIAQVAIYAGESNHAVQLLNDALNEGDELADVYNLRATLSARVHMMRGSNMDDYETATKADPFGARNFFFWGCALRASGKFQAALVRLQEALDRLREPTAEGLYRLSFRLTQVELGQDQAFADELKKQMALPYPGIDWLFTDAAVKLRDGKISEAAAVLTRAQQIGDPDAFSLRLGDYFFYQHRFDKELKPLFDSMKPLLPGNVPARPVPSDSPAPADASPPAVGLDVPTLPPPASPGATMAR